MLDVCTGTADLALAYWRASKGKVPVVGTDFCQPMLTIAREKCRRAVGQVANLSPRLSGGANIPVGPECDAVSGRQECLPHCSATGWQPVVHLSGITLLEADTLHLPFPDATFQIVSVAFGLRNLSDTDAGLREMVRVCRPGGRVAVLEFSTPTARPLGAIYGWYFQHLLPRIGQALARNSQAAYNYLPQSVGPFPQGEALADRMRAAGLGEVWFRKFTFGVAMLYVGRK